VGWAVSHQDKQEVIQQHFANFLSTPNQRTCEISWDSIDLPKVDLSHLDRPFDEAEIAHAISQLPSDRAPRPDGYTDIFFKKCWPIIKSDVMAVISSLHGLHCNDLNLVNKANIALIPKNEGAEGVAEYRPISLIHAIMKIITKALTLGLAPHMNSLISPCQSAFIKGRTIHDNFLYVRNITRRFHRNKTSALLLKLDISKAFDSVRWDYLISLMQHRGFPPCWCDWITTILSTSTSRVLLNGTPLPPIQHGRGLRQGDPLSPLLFVLTIDPLQHVIEQVTAWNLLSKLGSKVARFRASLYVDDAAIFIKPTHKDITNMAHILRNFGEASGLSTNLEKTQLVLISCQNIDLDNLLSNPPVTRMSFHCDIWASLYL
jgi:hypothetical protein